MLRYETVILWVAGLAVNLMIWLYQRKIARLAFEARTLGEPSLATRIQELVERMAAMDQRMDEAGHRISTGMSSLNGEMGKLRDIAYDNRNRLAAIETELRVRREQERGAR